MFFGTHDVRPTKHRMAVRVLYALSLLMVILPVESASDTFQLVGNGFCLDAKGASAKARSTSGVPRARAPMAECKGRQ